MATRAASGSPKKVPAKKATTANKSSASRKAPAQRTSKSAASAARTSPAKKTAKNSTAKNSTKRAPAKKASSAAAPKAPAKKTTTKKTAAKKTAAKKTTTATSSTPKKRVTATTSTAKKTAAATPAKKTAATSTAKKTATPAKKTAAASPARAASSVRPSAVGANATTFELPKAKGRSDGVAYTKDFSAKFLTTQRDALQAERVRLLGQADRLELEAKSLIEEGEMGDVQFDDESGEGDTMVVERDHDLVISAEARQTVEEIDEALERIKKGSYGYSLVSGAPLPKARLEAIPWATVLVEEKVGGIGRR